MNSQSGKSQSCVPLQWTWHHRALLALRRRLPQEQINCVRSSRRRAADDGAGDPDTGPGEAWDFVLKLLVREPDPLKEINDALERMEHGSYGVCEVTGLPVPPTRLRALPWTRHVREVAQRQQESRRTAR